MEQQRGAQAERPEPLQSTDPPGEGRQSQHRQGVQPIDQAQHRIGFHIRRQAGGVEALVEQPAELGAQKTAPGRWLGEGGVGVRLRIGVAVMLQMMRLPPAGAHLSGRSGQQRAQPPHQPRRLVAAVGQQAVVDGGDRQHAQQIKRKAPEQRRRSEAFQQQQGATQVGQHDDRWTQSMEQTPRAVAPDLGGTDDLVQGLFVIVKTSAWPRPAEPLSCVR